MILSSVSLLILGVIWGTSLVDKGRSLLSRHHWGIFYASALILFSFATYLGARQFIATYEHPIGRFFDVGYVLIFGIGVRIFLPYLVSLIFAFIFMSVASAYNKKYNERFFEKEEIQMGGLSLLLVGHPGWIFYLPSVIFIYLVLHVYHTLIHGGGARLPVYHLWVPIAIFVILISKYWIANTVIWSLLRI